MVEREIECIKLANNKEYEIIEKIKYENTEYVYLTNTLDYKDFCIRKVKEDLLCGLDNKEEYNLAMKLIREKHSNVLEKLGLL